MYQFKQVDRTGSLQNYLQILHGSRNLCTPLTSIISYRSCARRTPSGSRPCTPRPLEAACSKAISPVKCHQSSQAIMLPSSNVKVVEMHLWKPIEDYLSNSVMMRRIESLFDPSSISLMRSEAGMMGALEPFKLDMSSKYPLHHDASCH